MSIEINELKKMLKSSTAVLILDNGEPSFVVVGYGTYKELVGGGEKEIKVHNGNGALPVRSSNAAEVELLERINKDILSLKTQIEDEERMMTID